MGLKCSLLGHSFEPAGVEREREQQGSEVVTVARELERCARCDAERVVSESTEVTAVVDADDVDLKDRPETGAAGSRTAGGDGPAGGGIGGVADRAAAVDEEPAGETDGIDLADRDPDEEDAEILTDEEPERQPGQWPDEPVGGDPTPSDGPLAENAAGDDADAFGAGPNADEASADAPGTDEAGTDEPGADEAGTAAGPATRDASAGVPGGDDEIVCPDCGFAVDADSGYREGDPCPECGAWLTVE